MKKILIYLLVLSILYGGAFALSSMRLVKAMANCMISTDAYEQHKRRIPDGNIRLKINDCIKDGQSPIDKHFFPNAAGDMYLDWED